MNIRIAKGQRFIKLNKREREGLIATKELCAQLSTLAAQEAAEFFESAADSIQSGLVLIDATDPTEAEKVA